jgi:hypothetical protein
MQSHIWLLETEPGKHPVIVKAGIGVSRHLKVVCPLCRAGRPPVSRLSSSPGCPAPLSDNSRCMHRLHLSPISSPQLPPPALDSKSPIFEFRLPAKHPLNTCQYPPRQNPPYLPHFMPQNRLRNFAGYSPGISTLGTVAKPRCIPPAGPVPHDVNPPTWAAIHRGEHARQGRPAPAADKRC